MNAVRKPAEILLEARQRASRDKRAAVLAAVDAMVAAGEPITFLGVARRAKVSNWLVYQDGVREHIDGARAAGETRKAKVRKAGAQASAASLATDLELARAQLRQVIEERDRLKAAVQRGLGQQIADGASESLRTRIGELTEENQRQAAELKRLRDELEEVEGDRDAARQRLRDTLRAQNLR
ncbi:DUF6262 family protein [Streptomyces sp. NPDC046866]|uniref:DUF6262 family protein n=1 Tax=Streptomyces sp. NPDC046866 TaxID=3154921 RepID=UPI003453AD1E